jgi:Uncharacterized protein conserved in bacteria (DUF2059)
MKHIVTFLSVLLMASAAFAQTPGMPPPMQPGAHPMHTPVPMEATVLKSSYPDSTAFNAAFKELFLLIRPTPNVKERVETMFSHISRGFQVRGIDSAKAYDSVMREVDFSKDEKILFAAYRAQFSAEEIKSMIPFFKSSAGKHYLEVEGHLVNARNGEIDRYVNQTVNEITRPMGKQPQPSPPMRKPLAPNMGQPGMPLPNPTPGTPKN